MSGHTPGPWMKKGTQIRKGDLYLASSRQSGLPPEEAASNARLIAAAPELLEACVQWISERDNPAPCWVMKKDAERKMRAAISKATAQNKPVNPAEG